MSVKLLTFILFTFSLLGFYLISAPQVQAQSTCGTGALAGFSNCRAGCFDTACSSGPIPNDCATNNPGDPCNDPSHVCQAESSCGTSSGCARDPICQASNGICPYCLNTASGSCYNSSGQYLGQGRGLCDMIGNGSCITACSAPVCSSPNSNPHQGCDPQSNTCKDLPFCGTDDCSACPPIGPTPPPLPPGCFGGCGNYLQQGSCPAGQQQSCHFVSTVPGCTDGGSWNPAPGCTGSCGLCFGGPGPTPPPAPTPPPPCTPLGIGAGCGNPGNCQCQSGLSCQNNVCRTTQPPPPFCDFPDLGTPHQITPGWDQNGTPSSITNWDPVTSPPAWRQNHVDFLFNWNDIVVPGRSACTGQGRNFRIEVGVCEDGVTIYDPARCTGTPYYTETTTSTINWRNPGGGFSWVESDPAGPGSARFTIPRDHVNFWNEPPNNWVPHAACWNGSGLNCSSNELPPVINGKRSSTYWYQISGDCTCNGFQSPKTSNTWIFTYNLATLPSSAPPAPTLVCQAPTDGNSGRPDICDQARQGSPLGYGNASRYELSAKDGGPVGVKQSLYSHRYNILDLMTNNPQTVIGRNNGANQQFSLNGLTQLPVPLTDGHRYDWSVTTWDNNSPPSNPPNSPQSATWNFLFDSSSPLVGITGVAGCADLTTLPPNLQVTSNDPTPATPPGQPTPNQASGIKSVIATVYDDSAGGAIVSTQDLTAACAGGSCNLSTSWPKVSGHIYRIVVKNIDNADNSNTASTQFIFKSVCIGPWLQTTNGDVHSNDKVNTPGGPN